MPEGPSTVLKHNPIRNWLNTEAWILPKTEDLDGMRAFGRILNEHVIPAKRMRLATPVLHP